MMKCRGKKPLIRLNLSIGPYLLVLYTARPNYRQHPLFEVRVWGSPISYSCVFKPYGFYVIFLGTTLSVCRLEYKK